MKVSLILEATECIVPDQAADADYLSSSDESLSEQDNTCCIFNTRTRRELALVYASIRSLYRIASLLRRPRITNKYLKSRNRHTRYNAAISSPDYTRITDKIRFWRGYMTDRLVGNLDEAVVTESDIQLRREFGDHQLSDIEFLCQRLTRGNVLRREQFEYWAKHPDVPESYRSDQAWSPDTAIALSKGESSNNTSSDPGSSGVSKAAVPSSASSTSTPKTFSSVGFTTLQDDKTKASRPRTQYAASYAAASDALRVPSMPLCLPGEIDVECPFCHTELDWAKMQDRTVWT